MNTIATALAYPGRKRRSSTPRISRGGIVAAVGAVTVASLLLADPALAATDVRSIVSGTASGKAVSLGAGTYTFSNFQNKVGLDLSGKGGLTGAGSSSTVLEMTPGSSTSAGLVPAATGTANPLFLVRATGSPTLSGFTLQGTTQGHLYNGLEISGATNAKISNVGVKAVPGSGYNPPQETDSIDDQRSTNSVYSNVAEDGTNLAAVGIASNSSTNITVQNSTFQNNKYSAGGAFWQTKNITLTNVVSKNNRTGLNFERCSGTITITKPTILNESNQDFYIGSDQSSVKIVITDPVYSGHLRIRVPATYRGGANKVSRSDITVLVGGVNKTSSVVTWI